MHFWSPEQSISQRKKWWILISCNIFTFFSFMDLIFGVMSKNSSLIPKSWSSVLCSKSFRVLHFIFKYMIYCMLIFIQCMKFKSSSFPFSPWISHCSITIYQKGYSSIDLFLQLCQKSAVSICMGLFQGVLFSLNDLKNTA